MKKVDLRNYVSNPVKTEPLEFTWGWCALCESAFVRCPKCGNNGCNGGWGQVDGKLCNVCRLADQYSELARKAGLEPTKESFPLEEIKKAENEQEEIERLLGGNNEDSFASAISGTT